MYSNYQDYQRDVIESQLLDRIDWEQEQANMASYFKSRKEHIMDEVTECVGQISSEEQSAMRRQEMEDMRLASDLRQLADRLEARYK